MIHTVTVTFDNKPDLALTKLFAESHQVSFKKLSSHTLQFSTDNLNIAAEVAEQFEDLCPILSFDPNF